MMDHCFADNPGGAAAGVRGGGSVRMIDGCEMRLSQHFDREEFACKCGCGFDTVDAELLRVLENVREHFGPVVVLSGCRCAHHNAEVKGAIGSQHLIGRAADISIRWDAMQRPETLAKWLEELYWDRYGIGIYETFVHVDTRAKRARWRIPA